MVEQNFRQCKQCGVIKNRISSGMFDEKNKKWVDEDNGTWNGKVCPTCHRANVRQNMKIRRAYGKKA